MQKIWLKIVSVLQFLKLKWKISLPIAIFIIAVIYFSIPKTIAPNFTITQVKAGPMTQEVSLTGKVKPSQSVDLAFERSGKIRYINVKVGDKTWSGRILATLNNSDLAAQLSQASGSIQAAKSQLNSAQASLDLQKANLDAARNGTRPEEIQIAETAVQNALNVLSDSQINLTNIKTKADMDLAVLYDDVIDIVNDAYNKAEDAVRKQTDGIFLNPETMSPYLSFGVTNSQVKFDSEWHRYLSGEELKKWRIEISALSGDAVSNASLDSALSNAKNHLSVVRIFLDKTMDALAYNVDLSSTTAVTYKTNITTGRTNINTASTTIETQIQAIKSQKITNQNSISTYEAKVNDAQNSLETARKNLTLKQAGSTPEQIAAQEAQVRSSEANLSFYQAQVNQAYANYRNIAAQYDKTILRSPINGIISKKNIEVGEMSPATGSAISVISDAKFEVNVDVPDVDIAKIKVGNEARITLDAYGDTEIFTAKVISIDPAETIIEGVPTYKVKLQFDKDDSRVKSGMTANIDIITDKRDKALYVSQRAVYSKDGGRFILIRKDKQNIEVPIKTGIRDTEGNIEILEGLSEGQSVVIMGI